MIVSSESSHFVNFGDRHALDDVFLAHTEPVFGDVAVQRLSGLFLEFPANMVAAHKKNFFQTFQSEFLGNVPVDIGEQIVQYKLPVTFPCLFKFRTDAGSQNDDDHKREHIFFKKPRTKIVFFLFGTFQTGEQIFQDRGSTSVGRNADAGERNDFHTFQEIRPLLGKFRQQFFRILDPEKFRGMLRIPGLDLDRLFRLDQDQIVGTAVPTTGCPIGFSGCTTSSSGGTAEPTTVSAWIEEVLCFFAGVSLQNEQLPTRTISTL